MDNIIKGNICRTWWALDEVIGKDTDYEGSTSKLSLTQIIVLLEKYNTSYHNKDYNFMNDIIRDGLYIYNKTLDELKTSLDYSDIYSNLPDSANPIKLYISGWKGHLISIFIEFKNHNNYNVGVINCGLGSEIHGLEDKYTFGIIVFKDITQIQIKSFELYLKRCQNDNISYKIIYLTLFHFFGKYDMSKSDEQNPVHLEDEIKEEIKENKERISEKKKSINSPDPKILIYDNIESIMQDISIKIYNDPKNYSINNYTNVIKYITYSQIIGSCTFTNIIYFLYYIYCQKNPDDRDNPDNLDTYFSWYNYLKIQFKKEILYEIFEFSKKETISLDLYNIYNYIKIIIDTDTDISPDIIFKDEYDKFMIKKDEDIVFKPNIQTLNKTFKSMFDTIFNDSFKYPYITSEEFYNCIRNNNHEFIFNTIYEKNNNFINDTTLLPALLRLYNSFIDSKYIVCYEFYKFFKSHTLDIIINLENGGPSMQNDYIFIFRIIIVLCYTKKEEKDKFTNTKNQSKKLEFYMKKIDYLPIITNNYIEIIKAIGNDIIQNIQYLPDIKDYNDEESDLINTSDDDKLFYKIYKSKVMDDRIMEEFKFTNIRNDEIYFHNLDNFHDTNNLILKTYFNYAYNKNIIDDNPYDLTIIERSHNYNKNMEILCDLETLLIKNIDNKNSTIIKLYYKYIYLCYVNNIIYNDEIETSSLYIIINAFDQYLDVHLDSKLYWIYLIYTNKYKTKLINNFTFTIKDNIYSKSEEHFFKNINEIKCNTQNGHLYGSSLFSIYVYKLKINFQNTNARKCILPSEFDENMKQLIYERYKKNIFIHYNEKTKITIDLFEKYIKDNTHILNSCKYYILLNFNLKIKEENGKEYIIFIEKKENDKMEMIYDIQTRKNLIKSISDSKKLYCEKKDTTEQNDFSLLFNKYKDFYNFLQFNDPVILVYYCNKNMNNIIIYYQLNKFDLLFYATKDGIYYDINDIRYSIEFNVNELYNNYDILKLTNTTNVDDIKLLCLFDLEKINFYYSMNFFADLLNSSTFTKSSGWKEPKKIDDIHERLSSTYRIINIYKNEVILKNIDDLIVILTSCLLQNTSMILLKCIPYIIILFQQLTSDQQMYISQLLTSFNNIFALPIIYLLKPSIMNALTFNHIQYYKKIYEKYNYNIELNEVINSTSTFKISDDILLYLLNHNYITNDINDITNFFKKKIYINPKDSLYLDIQYKFEHNIIVNIIFLYNDSELHRQLFNIYTETVSSNNSQLIKKLLNNESSPTIKQDFIDVLKININNFKVETFNDSVTKYCNRYYDYLTKELPILPVQELIMGIGKTSIIIPYTCLLYINYHLLGKKITNHNIFIVLPENLIIQTFEIIITNIFSIFKKFIPLIYNINTFILFKILYTQNLLIVISDKDYKQLWLQKCEIFKKDNFIAFYDEVDFLADPLSCELNIPNKDSEKQLDTKQILDISTLLYTLLENELWVSISRTQYGNFINDNKIHKYLISYNKDLHQLITRFFQERLVSLSLSLSPIQINYIINTICTYLLLNQYNYNYGIPKNYNNSIISENYKFKAIPYKGIDDPLYGSEISDPILTQILTYFCYKFMKNSYRIHDYRKIIDYLETTEKFKELEILFNDKPSSLEKFKENKEYYINNIKSNTPLYPDTFNHFLKEILIQNDKYYETTKNISFTDLLMDSNVHKFIALTGTSYINLPEQIINTREIIQTIKKSGVEDKVRSIIQNNNILEKFYTIQENIDDVIFNNLCYYDVLIDIGAVFVNYDINKFIARYKNIKGRKKYIVYFENGTKLYNLDKNHIDILGNKPCKDYFFYFSHKNITGIDAKKYMSSDAKGLVIVTNKTIERDFAQGIYRMREILSGQKIDVCMSENSYNISMTDKSMQGGAFFNITGVQNIRDKFIRLLQSNQTKIENQKMKVLYKQNIFALSKLNDNPQQQCSNIQNYNIILYNNILTSGNNINIDDENINEGLKRAQDKYKSLINKIKQKYERMSIVPITTQVNVALQQQQSLALNVKQEMETSVEQNILQNLWQYLNSKINKNIKSINIDGVITLDDGIINQNSICLLYENNKISSLNYRISFLYALYIKDTNQLFLVDKKYLYRIFSLTANIKKFILFDYNSNLTFGDEIEEDLKLNIFITIKYYIINIPLSKKSETMKKLKINFTVEEINYIFEKKYKKIFTFIIELKNHENMWRKKYLKYKQKYLHLLKS